MMQYSGTPQKVALFWFPYVLLIGGLWAVYCAEEIQRTKLLEEIRQSRKDVQTLLQRTEYLENKIEDLPE